MDISQKRQRELEQFRRTITQEMLKRFVSEENLATDQRTLLKELGPEKWHEVMNERHTYTVSVNGSKPVELFSPGLMDEQPICLFHVYSKDLEPFQQAFQQRTTVDIVMRGFEGESRFTGQIIEIKPHVPVKCLWDASYIIVEGKAKKTDLHKALELEYERINKITSQKQVAGVNPEHEPPPVRNVSKVAAAKLTESDAHRSESDAHLSKSAADKLEEILLEYEQSKSAPTFQPSSTPSSQDSHLNAALNELEALIGLTGVKKDVRSLTNFIKVQQMRAAEGLLPAPVSMHMVFYGNPGTGKTTMARLLSRIYKSLGLLSKGHMVECDRSNLVAGYLGQTALKVQEVVKKSMGGVLFIDEAYALCQNKDRDEFGMEAINTLLKLMEDNRQNLIVIVAGYTDPMNKFLESNPGLRSRFNKVFHFDDYNPNELFAIFEHFCKTSQNYLSADGESAVRNLFAELHDNRGPNFGNGRDVRNIYDCSIRKQADRVISIKNRKKSDLMEIKAEDIPSKAELGAIGITFER